MRVTCAAKRCFALFLLLGIAIPLRAEAQGGDPVKPYILFVMDVSGSMDGSTGDGNPSCVTGDTRLNHARCAFSSIVNGYGDIIMGLGRFRHLSNDNNPADGCNMSQSVSCNACTDTNPGTICQAETSSGDRFQLLVPLVEQNQSDLLDWVDFSYNTCQADNSLDPELFAQGETPIVGSLRGVKRYFQGLNTPGADPDVPIQPYWVGPGADPIRNDPLKDIFVGPGQQCRPYIVIMMTDGAETCVELGTENTELYNAANSLLTTTVDGRDYRIEVKPIGLGRDPGDEQIENIAHGGGAADDPARNEGFYAQNEEELSLAISQIISTSIKFETCNDFDDDCDLLVDEAFPAKGSYCDDGNLGICKGVGEYVCTADGGGVECVITTSGQPAQVNETCNGLDDNCNGAVDEGGVCNGCDIEICDGVDNDCDTRVDESLIRTCGTDVGECTAGTETCNNGTWQGCTAIGGTAEVCDTLDNNCDGIIDGIAEECAFLPNNNPGVGSCQSGTRVCPSDGSGMWGPCIGEIGPVGEVCDLEDNDCDNSIDEDTGGDMCTGTCGTGLTECVNGTIQCGGNITPGDEICDALDNDCDGTIDEDIADAGPCDGNGTLCMPGTLVCIGGEYQCVGGTPPQDDLCDCEDNDCDTQVDEQGDALCPTGSSCRSCQCAFPCGTGEFPCPVGQHCDNGFCLYDACYNVTCEPDDNGDLTQCVDGQCVRSCDLVNCPAGFVCLGQTGECAPDTCETFPDRCTATQVCHSGECVANPCAGVECPDNQYCAAGACYTSCGDVTCPRGQRCVLGQCEADPCNGECGTDRYCDEAARMCVSSRCASPDCEAGEDCDPTTGECRADPCLGVVCPNAGEVCREGSCYAGLNPDAGDGTQYVAAVGGGCCSAAGKSGLSSGSILLMLLVLLGLARRRSRGSEADHA